MSTCRICHQDRDKFAPGRSLGAPELSQPVTRFRAPKPFWRSQRNSPSPEASLAEAFIIASTDKPTALAYLSPLGTPSAMAAALRICISADGPEAAFEWAKRAGLDEGSFDAEGKFSYLAIALQIGRWDDLFRGAKTVTESEIAEFAPLLHVVAMARMLSAVPVELRALAASQVPFEAREFRLASEPGDIVARREARLLFESHPDMRNLLGLSPPANVAADYALWSNYVTLSISELGLSTFVRACAIQKSFAASI